MKIEKIIANIFMLVISLYVLITIISQFSKQTPEFAFYGWTIFIIALIGFGGILIKFFKDKVF